jgi:membrane associated rhomboid family serine protease
LGGGAGVAFLAHIGGFVTGLLLGRVFAQADRVRYPAFREERPLYMN